jgi:hypothetical protein
MIFLFLSAAALLNMFSFYLGYAWYELEYGVVIDADDPNTQQFVCLIFLTIVTPMVSIGYLVIFLMMQPRAYQEFKAMIYCRSYQAPTAENLDSNRKSSTGGRQTSRMTIDSFGYYTGDGDRGSAFSDVRKDGGGGIELSMTDIPRTTGTSDKNDVSNDPARKTSQQFARFEDEQLMSFITDSETNKLSLLGRSTTNPPTLSSQDGGRKPAFSSFFGRSSASAVISDGKEPRKGSPRLSGFLGSRSITQTISGRSSLNNTSSISNTKSDSRFSSSHDDSFVVTSNPLRSTNDNSFSSSKNNSISSSNSKRRVSAPIPVLPEINEESSSRSTSKDEREKTISNGAVSPDVSLSLRTTKPIFSDDLVNASSLLSTSTVLSSVSKDSGSDRSQSSGRSPKQSGRKRADSNQDRMASKQQQSVISDALRFYARDSDFLSDARESVDAFYQNQYFENDDENA